MSLLVGVYQRIYIPSLLNLISIKKKKINSMIWQCIFFGAKISSSKLLINIIIECEQK